MKIWPWPKIKALVPEVMPAERSEPVVSLEMPPRRRSYDGGQFGRLLSSWVTSVTSPNGDARASLPTVRARSRELARNNDYMKGALRIISTNVVGQGIPFQAQVKKQRGKKLDDVVNGAIESQWAIWTKKESCHTAGKYSFQDIEGVLMRSVPKNGETFIRLHRQRFGGSRVPLALELIPPDVLDETYNVAATNSGNEIIMGIEVDRYQRPVAYWFHAKHPGDNGSFASYSTGNRVRVPARDIIHLFAPEDEEQTRAFPWIASAMVKLHHMQGMEQATVIGARARSCLMGFIQSPDTGVKGDAVQDGEQVTEFEAGAFKTLGPGETVSVPQLGSNTGELDPFMKIMLRGVGAGIGISYESLSKDYSMTNYSSARQALLEDRDVWKTLQQWLIRNFHQRVFEEWLDMAYLSNVLTLPQYATAPELFTAVKWMPRGWTWIDPLKEVEAYKAAVRSGFMTLADVHAMDGRDFEEYVANRKREQAMLDDAGIMTDTDPRMVSSAGLTQGRPQGTALVDPEQPNEPHAAPPPAFGNGDA